MKRLLLYIPKYLAMKKIVFPVLLVFITNAYAGDFDTLTIGLAGGYNNYNTFKGELYLQADFNLLERKAEARAGLNNRDYQFDFDNINDLDARSVGFFVDLAIYPLRKGLFVGARWEMINFNWLTTGSRNKIETQRDYTGNLYYSGTCAFLQLGYNYNLNDFLALKIFGQPGFQNFSISNASPSNMILEDHFEFIYNINLGIDIKISE